MTLSLEGETATTAFSNPGCLCFFERRAHGSALGTNTTQIRPAIIQRAPAPAFCSVPNARPQRPAPGARRWGPHPQPWCPCRSTPLSAGPKSHPPEANPRAARPAQLPAVLNPGARSASALPSSAAAVGEWPLEDLPRGHGLSLRGQV